MYVPHAMCRLNAMIADATRLCTLFAGVRAINHAERRKNNGSGSREA